MSVRLGLLACALAAASSFAQAADVPELLLSIDSGQPMSQGAALALATQAQQQGAKVRVLLCDAGGDLALAGREMPALKPRNVTPQQMLQGLIKGGAKVEVCALYLPNTGRAPTELIEGVTPAQPADVAAYLLKPGVRTLAY
ncbi:DsrE family protein [Tibeticola sp.]|uniref:DsrE family protein n=1 Tax=Tibeticola sp. TaxID=2005368 RepID=UPI00168C6B43|nr:DsrE family protein [Tibeticola sp.]QLQ00040.1 MAG: DsrE family protein [Burkholderiaceae bacterium]